MTFDSQKSKFALELREQIHETYLEKYKMPVSMTTIRAIVNYILDNFEIVRKENDSVALQFYKKVKEEERKFLDALLSIKSPYSDTTKMFWDERQASLNELKEWFEGNIGGPEDNCTCRECQYYIRLRSTFYGLLALSRINDDK